MSKTPKERRHIEKYFDFEDKVAAVNYYADTMLNKTITMFRYKNLPETLVERELELMLQTVGKCIVTEWEGDLIALDGNYAPPNDVYYRPTQFIVANPWANINHTFELVNRWLVKTGVESDNHLPAVLVRNDPLDRGLLPIIHKYGAMLTEVDLTMYLAALNYRTLYAIIANTDREYESGKSFLAAVKDGRQGIMLEEEMSNGIKTQPYANGSQGYITQIIELEQYLRGTFLNEIGLNANYNMKRERLSANETELNEDSLRPLIDAMLEERQIAVDEINAQFGTDISVEFDSAWEKYNLSLEDEMEMQEEGDEPIELTSDEEVTEEVTEDGGDMESTDGRGEGEADEADGEEAPEDDETVDGASEGEEEPEAEAEPEPAVEVNVNIETAEEVTVEENEEEVTEEEPEETPEEEDEEEKDDED